MKVEKIADMLMMLQGKQKSMNSVKHSITLGWKLTLLLRK
jgi:hypothetical protein